MRAEEAQCGYLIVEMLEEVLDNEGQVPYGGDMVPNATGGANKFLKNLNLESGPPRTTDGNILFDWHRLKVHPVACDT